MIARVDTAVIQGFDGVLVTAECDITKGLPSFNIVGLASKAITESRERVRAAITNSGFNFPAKHITISLAPANVVKEGSHLDLAVALSILVASGQLPAKSVEDKLFAGELGLNGELRSITGVLNITECAAQLNKKAIIVPITNSNQAALLHDIDVVGATTLYSLYLHLINEQTISPAKHYVVNNKCSYPVTIDDVRGQLLAKTSTSYCSSRSPQPIIVWPSWVGQNNVSKIFAKPVAAIVRARNYRDH